MSPWAAYAVGLLTLPVMCGSMLGALRAVLALESWLRTRHGISFELKTDRNTDTISGYQLRHSIWWELPWRLGPVGLPAFRGLWARQDGERLVVNRWVGFGNPEGRSLMVFRREVVG